MMIKKNLKKNSADKKITVINNYNWRAMEVYGLLSNVSKVDGLGGSVDIDGDVVSFCMIRWTWDPWTFFCLI